MMCTIRAGMCIKKVSCVHFDFMQTIKEVCLCCIMLYLLYDCVYNVQAEP